MFICWCMLHNTIRDFSAVYGSEVSASVYGAELWSVSRKTQDILLNSSSHVEIKIMILQGEHLKSVQL